MNTQPRTELLEIIAELQGRYPNWRLGQLFANVAGWADQDVWDVEDDQLLRSARSHLEQANGAMQSRGGASLAVRSQAETGNECD